MDDDGVLASDHRPVFTYFILRVPKLLAEVLPVSVYFCDSSRSLIHGVGVDK
jgi:hypothetical protein